MVFSDFDWNLHVIDRFHPPAHWTRYWTIDFGYTQPFCFQAWAKDEEGRLYRFCESLPLAGGDQRLGPGKRHDHGMDALRYLCLPG